MASQDFSAVRLYGRLLKYVKPYYFSLFISIIGMALFASAAPALAHMMGVVEQTLNDISEQRIHFVVIALFTIFLVRGVGTFLGKYFIDRVGRSVVNDLRIELFDKTQSLPSQYFDSHSSGRILSRITYDVEQVAEASTNALTRLVQEGLTVIGLMGYLIYLDARLTLIFLMLIPFIGVAVNIASRYFRKYSQRIQESIGEVTQIASESVDGFREVRVFGGEEYEKERFRVASQSNRKNYLKFALTNAINVPLNQQIIAIGLGVMVYLMFNRVMAGAMSGAEFLQFMTAASLIAKPLRAVTDVNAVIQRGVAACQSIFDVFDAPSETDTGTHVLNGVDTDVVFKDVRLRYAEAEQDALKGINLTVKAGTSVALVGHSGSGKTTLMNVLPRFYDLSAGDILIDGHDIRTLTLKSLRENIAFVGQQVTLFNGSVRDNIAYGMLQETDDDAIKAAAVAAHADEFISQLPQGYDTAIGEDGVLLSGGQRQRLAIARAILKDAPILILDEATSALDSASERHIQAALEAVMKSRTTFVIAHRLSTIEQADNIVVMSNGCIVEQGTHTSLLALDGHYAHLHAMQFSDADR